MQQLGKEYVKVKQKTIDPKQHLAEDPNIIQAWFRLYRNCNKKLQDYTFKYLELQQIQLPNWTRGG